MVVYEEISQGVDGVVIDAILEWKLAGKCGAGRIRIVITLHRLYQTRAVGRDYE